ncbi:hypothetical protein MY04_5272 [Flammeovirga sp. MY04]|uniref:WD40/YVTN/BNR-like repeat-containing protein n=1 Tax=Flammeovirga sp. MY04 TaxID=1191459 RepID=UPI00080634B2|nr:hypothetical protein [Flammeovirga sp. MY04]ANQ52604.1 hypothetical protein MY04_5272 [Flammeovirga sp. MY04]
MKKLKSILLLTTILCASTCFGQWISINPGAGGQVQDVVCDPSTPGTLYLASDMEGVYKSTDNGESWHMTGQLAQNRVFAVAVNPSDPNHLTVGTFNGLNTSYDGGKTYHFVKKSIENTIASARVDPHDNNVVFAGYGWRDDYNFLKFINIVKGGVPKYFVSKDKGKTWETIVLDQFQLEDRNIIDFVFHPKNKGEIYISMYGGILKTTNYGKDWKLFPYPKKQSGHRGLCISPDGSVLYGIFTEKGKNGLPYYTSTKNINWKLVDKGNGVALKPLKFWYPEVDVRSTENQHKLILSLEGDRNGLYEGTFNFEKGKLKEYSYQIIWQGQGDYDSGWDYAEPNPRYVHYTPKSWDRAIWSTTNQTIFEGEDQKGKYKWNNKYCIPHEEFKIHHFGKTFPTYSSRGTESTYTYDIAVADNYVIQGQADNGLVESWDGGKSWTNLFHRQGAIALSDVQSVEIAQMGDKKVVLAQATSGYGGHAKDGRIYYKILEHYSPKDQWHLLAGGPENKLGMPDGIYREIYADPHNPSRVYTFSSKYGLYVIDDLEKAIKNSDTYKGRLITGDDLKVIDGVKTIQIHPNDPNILYFTASRGDLGVFKGVKKGDEWTWNKILDGGDWDAELSVWANNGKTYMLYEGPTVKAELNNADYQILLSEDDGNTWKEIFTPQMAKEFRLEKNKSWYSYVENSYKFTSKGGIVGFDDKIIINYYNHRQQNGFGVFMGTIQANGEINWEDITGDLHFVGLTSSRIVKSTEGTFFYISTPGAGAWYRKLP